MSNPPTNQSARFQKLQMHSSPATALIRIVKVSAPLFVLCSPISALAQQALLEVPGLFGECHPIYAAASDSLSLYESPNLNSVQHEISYKQGWQIPYKKSEGLTRVISSGEVELASDKVLGNCDVVPDNGQLQLTAGQRVTYLFYLSEGFAKVRVNGSTCTLDIIDDPVLKYPDVQPWLRVLFRDGTSPGWLLNNGEQTIDAGIRC